MPPENEPIAVTHNSAAHRFEAVIGGQIAVCDYSLEGGRMVFTHTFVPSELRGRGVAEQLVRAALKWAWSEKLTIVPACSYVATFVQRHREFQPLIAE